MMRPLKNETQYSLLFVVILLSLKGNCQKINVAVTANAQYPMEEIETLFEKKYGDIINLTTGSSGKLFNQIDLGAPFDIFVAADTLYNSLLFQKKITVGKPVIYAMGTLVFWSHSKTSNKSISSLLTTDFDKIAIANPKTAPYGIASIEILKHYHLYNTIKDKIVTGESIGQVNTYIQSGSVDFAFTSTSSIEYLRPKQTGSWIEIPPADNHLLPQSVVLLKSTNKTNQKNAENFFYFLLGKEARVVFIKYGYK